MAKLTAAERYTARKQRHAIRLRNITLKAAETGARHARLSARYGNDWRTVLAAKRSVELRLWDEIVERNIARRQGVV